MASGRKTVKSLRHLDHGLLNHGGWFKVEGKQFAIFAVELGYKLLDAERELEMEG